MTTAAPQLAATVPARESCTGDQARAGLPLTRLSEAARQDLITSSMGLVHYVAAKQLSRGGAANPLMEYDDIVSAGVEGLIGAVDGFDPQQGASFATWAVLCIGWAIKDAVSRLDPLPRRLRGQVKEIDRVAATLASNQNGWPEVEAVAAFLGRPAASVRRTLELGHRTVVSLDRSTGGECAGDDNGTLALINTLADDDWTVQPEAHLDHQETRRMLREAVSCLPPREELIVNARYTQGRSGEWIAALLGVSESRVSQMHTRAILRLRAYMNGVNADPPRKPVAPVTVIPVRRLSMLRPAA